MTRSDDILKLLNEEFKDNSRSIAETIVVLEELRDEFLDIIETMIDSLSREI